MRRWWRRAEGRGPLGARAGENDVGDPTPCWGSEIDDRAAEARFGRRRQKPRGTPALTPTDAFQRGSLTHRQPSRVELRCGPVSLNSRRGAATLFTPGVCSPLPALAHLEAFSPPAQKTPL